MISAEEKRFQQRLDTRRLIREAEEAERIEKAQRPAILKQQRRRAIEKIGEELHKATGQSCEVTVWELDPQIERSVGMYLQKKGFSVTRRCVSAPEYEYGGDGELHENGHYKLGTVYTIRW